MIVDESHKSLRVGPDRYCTSNPFVRELGSGVAAPNLGNRRRLKFQTKKVVEIPLASTCAQWETAVRLHCHIDMRQFGCVTVLLRKAVEE
jgi:hypothetical protein